MQKRHLPVIPLAAFAALFLLPLGVEVGGHTDNGLLDFTTAVGEPLYRFKPTRHIRVTRRDIADSGVVTSPLKHTVCLFYVQDSESSVTTYIFCADKSLPRVMGKGS